LAYFIGGTYTQACPLPIPGEGKDGKNKLIVWFNSFIGSNSPLSSVTATQSNPLGNWEQFNFVPNVSFSFPIAKIAKLFSLLLQCARVTVFASE